MRTESKKLLFDIATACRAIQGFNAGRSLGDYSADEMRRAATERMFEIIGEAVVPSRHSAIVSFTASSRLAPDVLHKNGDRTCHPVRCLVEASDSTTYLPRGCCPPEPIKPRNARDLPCHTCDTRSSGRVALYL